jgi:hypothetical protein
MDYLPNKFVIRKFLFPYIRLNNNLDSFVLGAFDIVL